MTSNNEWDVESSFSMESPDLRDAKKPSKKVVMPDIHTKEYLAKEVDPKTADNSFLGIDKSIGFNPYNTGVLQKK